MDTPSLPALIDQLKATREGVGLYDASSYGQFFVNGPDAAGFLHRMLSNEVQKLEVGEGRYQGLLDRKGMTLSLFYLRRLGPQQFLGITPPQLTEKTLSILVKMKFIEKVVIENASNRLGLLQVIGPGAEALLKERVPSLSKDLLLWREDPIDVPFFLISGPREQTTSLLESLAPQAVRLSETAVRLVRMAAGFPEYGVDIDETHILLETPVPVAHQRNKGCYPGQEVIERISTYGKGRAPKRLIHFRLAGEKDLPRGTAVLAKDGSKAGAVMSALFNPLDQSTLVMASVETKFADDLLADVGQLKFLPPAPL